MTNIKRIHPGVYIKESLQAMKITIKEFSIKTGILENTLLSIVNCKTNITYEIANKLASYFDNSINYWINLQVQYDNYLKNAINSDK